MKRQTQPIRRLIDLLPDLGDAYLLGGQAAVCWGVYDLWGAGAAAIVGGSVAVVIALIGVGFNRPAAGQNGVSR